MLLASCSMECLGGLAGFLSCAACCSGTGRFGRLGGRAKLASRLIV